MTSRQKQRHLKGRVVRVREEGDPEWGAGVRKQCEEHQLAMAMPGGSRSGGKMVTLWPPCDSGVRNPTRYPALFTTSTQPRPP